MFALSGRSIPTALRHSIRSMGPQDQFDVRQNIADFVFAGRGLQDHEQAGLFIYASESE